MASGMAMTAATPATPADTAAARTGRRRTRPATPLSVCLNRPISHLACPPVTTLDGSAARPVPVDLRCCPAPLCHNHPPGPRAATGALLAHIVSWHDGRDGRGRRGLPDRAGDGRHERAWPGDGGRARPCRAARRAD